MLCSALGYRFVTVFMLINMSNSICHLQDVPLDITLKILERLNGHELGIAECVSKLWMGAISSSELWQRKCKEELSITIKRTAQAAVGAHATPQTFREAFALVAAHLKLRKVGLKGDPQEVPMRMMRAFCRVREIWGPPGNQMPELEERMLPGLPHEQLIGRKSDRRLAQAYGGMLDVVTTPSKNIVSAAQPYLGSSSATRVSIGQSDAFFRLVCSLQQC